METEADCKLEIRHLTSNNKNGGGGIGTESWSVVRKKSSTLRTQFDQVLFRLAARYNTILRNLEMTKVY